MAAADAAEAADVATDAAEAAADAAAKGFFQIARERQGVRKRTPDFI